jgi:hypothetical protein
MNTICTLHDQAMHIMNEAFSLKNADKHEEARQKFLQACELESESAFLVEKLPENEPSRSMLFLGAASLAWYGEDFELAERLVGEGMSGYPSDNIKNDLRKLLDDIKFSVAAKKSSEILHEEEAEIRLYGVGVGYGRIKSQCLISRIDAIDKLISRTTQRKYGFQFESRPKKRKEFPDYQIDIEWADAGSFGMKIRLTQKINEQMSLFQDKPSKILRDVIDNIELLNSGDTESLKKNIQDEEYYIHFITQAKEIFPDGNMINHVGFITKNKSFPIKNSRKEIRDTILRIDDKSQNNNNEDRIKSIIGYLRVSDGIKGEFKIIQDDDKTPIKIKVRDALEELAKKHFGDKIEATCEKKGKSYHLIDITPISD